MLYIAKENTALSSVIEFGCNTASAGKHELLYLYQRHEIKRKNRGSHSLLFTGMYKSVIIMGLSFLVEFYKGKVLAYNH